MEQENDQHQLLPQSRSKYIITIYHHDECLELLNDYYIPQILCCKEKVNELLSLITHTYKQYIHHLITSDALIILDLFF
jgi:hypothetical protein